MRIATAIARGLLGLVFVVFGLNGFLHFIPMPLPQGQAGQFAGAMFTTGYIYVVAALQVIGGILLLLPGYVPLGLLLLGPVIVNILLFHVFLDRTGLPMAVVISALALFLLARHWDAFRAIFHPFPPTTSRPPEP
jgi:putative oxidoreductase